MATPNDSNGEQIGGANSSFCLQFQ
ncbi:uncharacterized protein G2W53_001525 [Senna tora]|uniref:Uncharacterized protein n=1 Tax=Senna tora TaxID=362788 RepID=A0A835CLK7_9FABA|nr:uncharacterized protein G2W53_001525 [Senna tora]